MITVEFIRMGSLTDEKAKYYSLWGVIRTPTRWQRFWGDKGETLIVQVHWGVGVSMFPTGNKADQWVVEALERSQLTHAPLMLGDGT